VLIERYLFYGLCVSSQLDLHETLVTCESTPDVSVVLQTHCSLPLKEAGDEQFFFSVSPQFAQFQYRNVALFTIRQGREIIVAPFGDVDRDLLVNTLLGTPLGILLLQRNHLVFHASAVEIDCKSVCFIGPSGSGKSTTACSLISLGHQLISDDVVAFNLPSNPGIVPLPAYPWMKVSSKASHDLNLDATMISELQISSPKKKYTLAEDRFAKEPAKLKCIYILSWGSDLMIEPLKPKDAVLSLLANAYGFVPAVEYPQEEKRRFFQMMQFVKDIPCFKLQRPKHMDTVVEVGNVVSEHLSTLNRRVVG